LRRPRHLPRVEERLDVVPERARLARHAVVRRGLAREHEPPSRARAGRVQEVAVAGDGIDPLQAAAELAAHLVVQERRGTVAAREAPLLEPEQDDDVELPRARSAVVEDRHAPGLARGDRAYRRPLENGDDVLAGGRAPVAHREGIQLVEGAQDRLQRAGVGSRVLRGRRALEPPGVPCHSRNELADRVHRLVPLAEPIERRQRGAAQALGLLVDPLRLGDRASAQPTLDEVHRAPLEPRERGAEVAKEIATTASAPGEAEQAEQGATEGRLAEPSALLDRVRDAEWSEDRVERGPPAVDGVADETDPLRADARAQQLEQLRGDELGRAARARPFEEAKGAVDRRTGLRLVGEQLPLEMEQGGRHVLAAREQRGAELLDRTSCEPGQIVDGPLERGERNAARLVGDRDGDVGSGGKRLEQRPLRGRQILEAVGEDRLVVPGGEVGAQELGGAAAEPIAIPEPEPVELLAVGKREPSQVAAERLGLDERRLHFAESDEERVGEPLRARGLGEPVEARALDGPAYRQRALDVGRHGAALGVVADDVLEEVVEGPDPAGEQRGSAAQEIPLDALHVHAVRHDEPRIRVRNAIERIHVAIEEQRDLAGVSRPHDERERHSPIVVPPPDALSYAIRASVQRARTSGRPERAGRQAVPGSLGASSTRPLRTSGGGRGARPPGRASSLRSRRRDRPASLRGVRR
jgi:hypothetical protein